MNSLKRQKKIRTKEGSLTRQLLYKTKMLKSKSQHSKKLSEMKILKTLKYSKMNWFNVIKWPAEIIDDIRQWILVRSALKEIETQKALKTFKYEIRIDQIGRLYTVINIPEELWPFEKENQVWPWMVEQLRELDDVLMERQLNDLLYPEVTPIEGSPAYLVVLTPSTDSLKWSKFFGWSLRMGFILTTLFLANRISLKLTGQYIIDFLTSLIF